MADGESRYQVRDVIARYVELRDEKENLADRHKAEMAPLNASMEVIEAWLQQQLNLVDPDPDGSASIKTDAGTAYRSTVVGAKVTDWEAVLRLVIESEDYELLVRNVNKTRAQERLAQYGEMQGVEFTTIHRVLVRRG